MDNTVAACIALGRLYDFEEGHSRQDARIAVRLFDLTADLHRLEQRNRELLLLAALLHDIGYVEGYSEHHKAAFRLIDRADLPGLTERERLIVANVARYHRGAKPSPAHKGFAAVSPEDREAVQQLAAILRLADGLDRSHSSAVRDLDLEWDGGRLVVWVVCPGGCSDEIWAGEKKGRMFSDLFGIPLVVYQRPAG